MPITAKLFFMSGGFNVLLAVLLGAFGAHGLQSKLSEQLMAIYQTGVQYHFYHAIGLILIGLTLLYLPDSIWLKWSGWVMFAGIILFSGSLYLLALFNMKALGMVTPIGGLAFIFAWGLYITAIAKS